jgi:hypothetical protein
VRDGEAEAGALLGAAGGEEGVEDGVADLGRHPGAGVLHHHADLSCAGDGPDGELPSVGHGLDGVDDEVGEDLAHLPGLGHDGWRGRELERKVDALLAEALLHERHRGADGLAHVDGCARQLARAGVGAEVVDDLLDAGGAARDQPSGGAGVGEGALHLGGGLPADALLQARARPLGLAEQARKVVGAAAKEVEGVGDLVHDSVHQVAQRRQARLAHEGGLGAL